MAFFIHFLSLLFFNSFLFSLQQSHIPKPLSLSFPLQTKSFTHHILNKKVSSSLVSAPLKPSSYNFKSSFKYSMALIISLPIGTPPQKQQMVLDTGSQLSWIKCHKKTPKIPPTTSFNPYLSSSFSILPCTHPICKPRIPDYTLPTSCDQNRLCHYSYFYADGTYAQGNLIRERFTFSSTQSTPPLIIGCADNSDDNAGILGMNLGRLSFASQAKLNKFSYCVPNRVRNSKITPTGGFYLGQNPNSHSFHYIQILTFAQSQRMPNLDPLAYTIGLSGIRIGNIKLNISRSAFKANTGGSGQTMIDSGSEYTYLVEEAYVKVKEEIVRIVGGKLKKGYVYSGTLDMCFDGDVAKIRRLIGNMVFEFDKGVEVVIDEGKILDDVGGGVHCLGIASSDLLGVPSNIIGNFHQQNLWVEFDLANRRVGFGKADCSRSV